MATRISKASIKKAREKVNSYDNGMRILTEIQEKEEKEKKAKKSKKNNP